MLLMLACYASLALLVIVWWQRGFFNAFMHLLCTVAAGAIAFSVWEPLAELLLRVGPQRGFLVLVGDTAWGLALGLPFGISLLLLRVITDKLVPANVICTDTVNYIGSSACAVAAGVITVGVGVMSIGSLRFGGEFMGYRPVGYTTQASGRGSLVRASSAPLLVDAATGAFYTHLSASVFRHSDDTLGRWRPGVHLEPGLLRLTLDDKTRNTLRDQDVSLVRRYTVGDAERGTDMSQLLRRDMWFDGNQSALDINGASISRGHLEGVVITFKAGAKERKGGSQVIVGPAQVRMLAEGPDGRTQTYFPVAMLSQGDSSDPLVGRWRFDSDNLFIASVGGASDATMAFEYALPVGWRPLAVVVKGVRLLLPGAAQDSYAAPAARDAAVVSGKIIPGFSAIGAPGAGVGVGLVAPDSFTYRFKIAPQGRNPRRDEISLQTSGIQISPAIGFAIRKGAERGLKVADTDDGPNRVVDGEEQYAKTEIGRIQERALRIDRFDQAPDVRVVQVDISPAAQISGLGPPFQNASTGEPVSVVDTNGLRYEAIGYVYIDDQFNKVRYTPSSPLAGLNAAPGLTRTRQTATLRLVFRVSAGVELAQLVIGNKAIADWRDTPVPVGDR